MEGSSRDRSPLRHPAAANIGLMSSFVPTDDTTALHRSLAQDSTNTFHDPSFANNLDQNPYFADPSFDAYSQPAQQPAGLGLDDIAPLTYNSAIPDHLSPHSLSNHTSPAPEGFPNLDYTDALDSTLANELDLLQQPGLNYTSNQLDSMSAAMNTHNPTPPHLLPQMGRKSSSPSPRATPNQSPFLQRQRNTSESLGPPTAQYLSQNVDWGHVQGHRGHRRMHSDNLSDISSHSAQASPYLPTMDSFDQNHASPMLNPQDPTFSDGLGIGTFSIADNRSYSPAVSPHISPRLGAQQQPLPQFTSADGFGLSAPLGGTYAQPNGFDTFAGEAFPSLSRGASPGETGMEHMSPPEVVIDLAPPTKPFETSRPSLGDDTLALPSRGNRARAKSDSSARPMTPSFHGRGRSPSQPGNSLSPYPVASNPSSREPSPARGRNGSLTGRYRSTSATSDQLEYILDLADPQRSPSTGDSKRQQKHPATFQCHLCPKRFTRAYNLRSHLRTHTDERPFVCTVCDKAFARQHDRKRHESLHSGEKKFVCRGPLKNGGSWGCSRRFARADALGRHFRSEAGRVCIKPLLEEEAVEQRQALWQEQQAQVAAGYPVVEPQMPFFPAAILQQYPALAGFDWNQPQNNIPEEEYAGRSSFDASSGGEMYDELSENEMGIGSMNVNGGYGLQPQHQMNSYSGNSMGDFGNGFEGR